MKGVEIAPEAQADLLDILRYSRRKFGNTAGRRYHLLIKSAYEALGQDPRRAGVVTVGPRLKLFHVRHVKDKAGVAGPRHIVVFLHDRSGVRIVRILHDAMDLPARLRDL